MLNFKGAFNSCSSLTYAPESLFLGCTSATDFNECFANCTKLTDIAEDIIKGCASVENCSYMFSNTSLRAVPEKLFADCPMLKYVNGCFDWCYSLVTVPPSIFDNNRRITSLSSLFRNCHFLQGESPYTEIDGVKWHLYERADNPDQFVAPLDFTYAFSGCNNLSDYNAIPQQWKN